MLMMLMPMMMFSIVGKEKPIAVIGADRRAPCAAAEQRNLVPLEEALSSSASRQISLAEASRAAPR
jgi:hypothetical protein